MSKYNGSKCIVCGEVFTDDDDVVVCAECGTPYHRDCYLKEGKCINTALHESGGSWKADAVAEETEAPTEEKLTCPRCGAVNSGRAIFCERCGFPISAANNEEYRRRGENYTDEDAGEGHTGFSINFGDPLCGLNPEEDYEGVKLKEMADFVGANTYYYLPLFQHFKNTGRKLSWNLSAMIFPPIYFFYRKMYAWGILSIFLGILIDIPPMISVIQAYDMNMGILSQWANSVDLRSASFSTLYNVCIIASYVYLFMRAAFANWLYYRHVLGSVSKIKEQHGEQCREILKKKGGVSPLSILFLIVGTFMLSVIISFVLVFGGV